jgi:hypothetical protein
MASKLERARMASTNLRRKLKSVEPLRAASAMGGGAAVGVLEKRGIVPASVLGFPTKPLVAAAAYLVGYTSALGSGTAAVGMGVGDGVMGAYGYAAAKAGTLIAGDDSGSDETEDIDL